ncbi:hypothetical protein KY492_04475 [Brevibacterium sp. PAMC21349]|nr:hypothetical protein KY492_04475 [Brevibacterium sp. PAMC21349]
MGKKRGKKNNNNTVSKPSNFVVMAVKPEEYKPFDPRAHKPICYMNPEKPASMVLQEIDTIESSTKINGKRNNIEYFAPNNVGLLLSIANKALIKAKLIYKEKINPDSVNHFEHDKEISRRDSIINKSTIVYEYIESIQTAIVFGYTALETFSNLSIPNNYEYISERNNKGIIETYDKQSIERWLTLKMKLSNILVNVYKTKNITQLKIWAQFLQFEEFRNEIIHQKSISDTKFYHKYFKKNFFDICEVPEEIIKFYYEELIEQKNTTNPLWPWIINHSHSNGIPVRYDYKPENFEVVGNIYEGRNK